LNVWPVVVTFVVQTQHIRHVFYLKLISLLEPCFNSIEVHRYNPHLDPIGCACNSLTKLLL
ncbi:hypothetical protein T4D_4497, partial [Trichinella pseudospiralis]